MDSVRGMLHDLKKLVFDYRINKKTLTTQEFEKQIETLARETRTQIERKFFKSKKEIHNEALVEFAKMVQRENKDEEQKGEYINI